MSINGDWEKALNIETWDRGVSFDQIKFLEYGESGVEKTRFASTWPNAFFLDADKGMMSVTEKVDRMDIDTWKNMQDAYVFLAHSKHPYKTVVLDTLNEIQHIAMQNVLTTFPTIKRSYKSLPGQSDYGKALYDFDILIRSFINLPMHVVLISQVKQKEFQTDPIIPGLVGKKTATNIAKKMSVIAYMYKAAVSASDGASVVAPVMGFNEIEHVSKDRTGRLPASIIEPTYDKLAFYWKEEASKK